MSKPWTREEKTQAVVELLKAAGGAGGLSVPLSTFSIATKRDLLLLSGRKSSGLTVFKDGAGEPLVHHDGAPDAPPRRGGVPLADSGSTPLKAYTPGGE